MTRQASGLISNVSSTAASIGRSTARTALAIGALPLEAAATAVAATAVLTVGATVCAAAVVITVANDTASAVAPMVERSLTPIATVATTTGTVGSAAMAAPQEAGAAEAAVAGDALTAPPARQLPPSQQTASPPSLEELGPKVWRVVQPLLLKAGLGEVILVMERDGHTYRDQVSPLLVAAMSQ